MACFEHFEVVVVADSEAAAALGVDGREGVVLGVSEPEDGVGIAQYAVSIGGEDCVMLPEGDLTSTGRRVSADEIYDGAAIQVAPQPNGDDVHLRRRQPT